jgi:hypothetical protein
MGQGAAVEEGRLEGGVTGEGGLAVAEERPGDGRKESAAGAGAGEFSAAAEEAAGGGEKEGGLGFVGALGARPARG